MKVKIYYFRASQIIFLHNVMQRVSKGGGKEWKKERKKKKLNLKIVYIISKM